MAAVAKMFDSKYRKKRKGKGYSSKMFKEHQVQIYKNFDSKKERKIQQRKICALSD